MGLQFDPPNWLSQLGALVTAGGGSVVVVKLIEKAFARDDREATDRASISSELRADIRELKAEIDKLNERVDEEREAKDKLVQECAELRAQVREYRAENEGLRTRYHEFSSFAQVLVGTIEIYHDKLGLPESDRIEIPKWVYRPVPGPTSRDAAPKPPEQS